VYARVRRAVLVEDKSGRAAAREFRLARPADRKFLGFSLTSARKPKRRVAAKALLRFKRKVRERTGRTGVSVSSKGRGSCPAACLAGRATTASRRRPRCWRGRINGYGNGCGP